MQDKIKPTKYDLARDAVIIILGLLLFFFWIYQIGQGIVGIT